MPKKKRENNTSKGLKYVMWGEFYRHCLYKDAQLIVARSGSEGLVLTTLKVLKDPCWCWLALQQTLVLIPPIRSLLQMLCPLEEINNTGRISGKRKVQEIKLRAKQRTKEIISIGDKNKIQAVTEKSINTDSLILILQVHKFGEWSHKWGKGSRTWGL